MAKIWITYNWDDNQDGDVDFIAQELEQAGVEIKLDRWNISAGKRLWEQIEHFIVSPWLLIATNNSLSSEPCKEEFAYALDRALNTRGKAYPVIALFIGSCDENLIPAGILTRLYVSITDPDWKDRIVAAAEGRPHEIQRKQIEPYYLKVHTNQTRQQPIAIEVRPRAGVWAPFIAAIPITEKEMVDPHIMIGPRNVPTSTGALRSCGSGISKDNKSWHIYAGDQATPTQSYFVWCKVLPSKLIFGVKEGNHQYQVEFNE